jgi:hypothetical protein
MLILDSLLNEQQMKNAVFWGVNQLLVTANISWQRASVASYCQRCS